MTDEAVFSHAAVAAPHALAAEAGRNILAQGGNAIEAMVAMAATIAVAYPHMNAIGGDGFWLIRDAKGRVRAIEACGFAGEGASIARYRELGHETIPARGPEAALTVPGAIGGWALALEISAALGGRLPLPLLIENAIAHARAGAPVSASEARFDPLGDRELVAAPGFASAYLDQGKPMAAGATRTQPRLADALAQLAHAGLDDFYRGDIARELAADLERIGSPVTRRDLKAYRANWREPLSLRWKNATLFNTPAPTQGFASLMMLGLYERLAPRGVDSLEHAHALIEAAKRALALRDEVCVDFTQATADFARLLSPEFLSAEAARIDMQRAATWPLKPANGDTVWMGAIDAQGVAVSFIQSIYWEFGSGCVLERTGVLMQNRGVSFSLDPASPNSLRPGKRPFHTLNPPLAVFDDGRVLSYGSMGGDGQPQFQAQIFTRIAGGARLADAVAAPRHLFGRSWGSASASVKVEASYDDGLVRDLERRGHFVERLASSACDKFGHAGALTRGAKGEIAATHDPRSDGGPAGL